MYEPTDHASLLPLEGAMGYSRHVRISSCRLDDAHVQIRGELVDDRADFESIDTTVPVHGLVLRMTVRTSDTTIIAAEVALPKLAFRGVCDQLPVGPEALIGVRIGKGLRKTIRERFGGVHSCYHLISLLNAMIPALNQCLVWNDTFPTLDRRGRAEDVPAAIDDMRRSIRNTCHAWREGGYIESQLDEGNPLPVLERVAPRLARRYDAEGSKE